MFLLQSDVPLPRYRQKRCFASFKTGFTAFTVLFWAIWWLFCVNWTYRCKDTGKNVALSPLKSVLRHSPFFFEHFGGYFPSIGHTVTNISATMLLLWLWNRFYCIRSSFLSILMVILRQSNVELSRYRWQCCFAGFETAFTVFAVLFWALCGYFASNEPTVARIRTKTLLHWL